MTVHTITQYKEILRIIEGVRKILTPPSAWTRGVPARNKHNQVVIPFDSTATCYDIVGAIMCIAERLNLKGMQHHTMMYLRNFTNKQEIGRWNDDRKNSHDDMLLMLDKAITQLKSEIGDINA